MLYVVVWFHKVVSLDLYFCFSCQAIDQLKTSKYDIPCIVGGKEYRTAHKMEQLCVSLSCPPVHLYIHN